MQKSNKLLFNDPPLVVSPALAVALKSVDEAIVMQQVHYWLQTGGHERDGRTWIYNSIAQWHEQFPFWSEKVIRRIIESLRGKGLLITANYNQMAMDRTLWYSIDYDKLETYAQMGEPFAHQGYTICPPGVNHLPARGKAIPETTSETTTDTNRERRYHPAGQMAAGSYIHEAKRHGVEMQEYIAMYNLLIDTAGWTHLVDAGDDRKLDYAKQAALAMIKMGDDSLHKLQVIIELWQANHEWRNTPPTPDAIAQYASQLRSGVVGSTAKQQRNGSARQSKVEASIQAVDNAFAMMRAQGFVFDGDEA